MARLTLLALLLALVSLGCDDDPPATPAAPTAASTSEAPPAETAAPPAATPPAIREPGDSIVLEYGPASARWERIEPGTPVEEMPPFRAYRRSTDELWALRGEPGVDYALWPLPGSEQLLGAGTSGGEARGDAVLVDLSTGEVTQLLPFSVAPWGFEVRGAEVVELRIVERGHTADGALVPSGRYTLDLETGRLTYLDVSPYGPSRVQRFALPRPLPDGSYHPGATVAELRLDADAGHFSLTLVNEDTEEGRLVADEVHSVVPSPDGRWLAGSNRANELWLLDLTSGEWNTLGTPAYWSTPRWSPGGRYLAAGHTSFGHHVLVWELPADGEALRQIGPIEDAAFIDWHPDGSEALLLGDYNCQPDGFVLDRLFVDTGEVRRIPTAVNNFWDYRWSPDGEVIASAAPELPVGLIDPDSGEVFPSEALSIFEEMQDFSWAAGGEWLIVMEIGGRGRCE